jgi:hypothetical protein
MAAIDAPEEAVTQSASYCPSQKQTKDRPLLLKQKDFASLLNTHTSTSERMDFYQELSIRINTLLEECVFLEKSHNYKLEDCG